ncbi:Ig-like domain-containing protein, partial [Thorsellia anophelis]
MLSTKIVITNPETKTASSHTVNATSHFSVTNGDVVMFGTDQKPYILPKKTIKLVRKGDNLEIILSENPLEVAILEGYFKLTNPPKIAAVTSEGVVTELVLADGAAISELKVGQSSVAEFNGQIITVNLQDLTFFEGSNHDAAIITAIVGVGAVLLGTWFYAIEDDNEVKDTQKPSAPVVNDLAYDNVGEVQGTFKSGEFTDDEKPTFYGEGEPGGSINVYINGEKQTLTNPIVIGKDGKWELDFGETDITLNNGKNDIQFSITDPSGNEGNLSPIFEVNVDTSIPTKENPFISEITLTANEGSNKGKIEAGAITDDATPVLSGNAESNIQTVKIYATNPFGQTVLLGESTVINGQWTFDPPNNYVTGTYTLHAVPVTKGGNELKLSDAPTFEFQFYSPVPAQVALISVRDASESYDIINPNDLTKSGELLIRGSAEPNTTVSVMVNGIEVGIVQANELGYWELPINLDGITPVARGFSSFTSNDIAADGKYAITASMDNGLGGKWTTADWNIELNRGIPNAPEFETVLDHQGTEKGALTQNATTDDSLPILQGKGIPNTTIEIYDNGQLIGQATTNTQGEWSFVPSSPLANGEHKFTTVQIDKVGDRSEPSDAFVINIEVPEGALIIAGAEYQSGNQTIKLGEQAYTNNTKPTIFGFGKAGDLIEISYGDKKGTTTVGSDGKWAFTITESLKDGEYIFNAKVVTAESRDLVNDELINSSNEVFSLKVLAAIPDVPVITEIFDTVGSVQTDILTREGKLFNDPAPYVSGTGIPGYIINLYNFGKLVGSTTVKTDGSWSLVALNAYAGNNEYTVTTVDMVGDVSAVSPKYEIFFDPTLNTAPLVDENDSEALRLVDDVEIAGQENKDPNYKEYISRDGFTNDSKPTFTGKSLVGVKNVNIYQDGELVATVKVLNGIWEYTPESAFTDGEHTFEAAAVSDYGNEGPKTKIWNFTVDTQPPPAFEDVVIEGRDPNTGDISTGTPTIKGKGEPDDKVIVGIDRDGDGVIDDTLVFAPNPLPGELPGIFDKDGNFEVKIPDENA